MYVAEVAAEAALTTALDITSNAIASEITTDDVLQKEFATTIKIGELGVYCLSTTKAVKPLKNILKTQTNYNAAKKSLLNNITRRLDKPYDAANKLRAEAVAKYSKVIESSEVIDGRKINMDWDKKKWSERGYAFEDHVATYTPGRLPYGFKTFDFFTKGRAISVKTLDINTDPRNIRPQVVRYQIKGYINEMMNFKEYQKLEATNIVKKELHLAIPVGVSQAHMEQIAYSMQYAADNNIAVIITRVK